MIQPGVQALWNTETHAESSVEHRNRHAESSVEHRNRHVESSVEHRNRHVESSVEHRNRHAERSVEHRNRHVESSVEHRNIHAENSAEHRNRHAESSVEHRNRQVESSVEHRNRQVESSVEHRNRHAESSVEHRNRQVESSVEHRNRHAENSVEHRNRQVERSVEHRNRHAESFVEHRNRQVESSVEHRNRQVESSVEHRNRHVESSVEHRKRHVSWNQFVLLQESPLHFSRHFDNGRMTTSRCSCLMAQEQYRAEHRHRVHVHTAENEPFSNWRGNKFPPKHGCCFHWLSHPSHNDEGWVTLDSVVTVLTGEVWHKQGMVMSSRHGCDTTALLLNDILWWGCWSLVSTHNDYTKTQGFSLQAAMPESMASVSHCFHSCPTSRSIWCPADVWSYSTQNQWPTSLNITCFSWQLILITPNTKPVVLNTPMGIFCISPQLALIFIAKPVFHHWIITVSHGNITPVLSFGWEIHYYSLILLSVFLPRDGLSATALYTSPAKLGRIKLSWRNKALLMRLWSACFLSLGCKLSPPFSG